VERFERISDTAQLSISYDRVGNVLVAQGKLDEALTAYASRLRPTEP
jgi:hypothetical protein